MKKEQKKAIIEEMRLQDDMSSESEHQFDEDFDRKRSNAFYPSNDDPDNMFQYKKLRLIPESDTNFPGLIDKDVNLAKMKESLPDPEFCNFLSQTIVLFKKTFVIQKEVILSDRAGKPLIKYFDGKPVGYETEQILVFNEEFSPVTDALLADYKYRHVSSRAMGEDRESVLDRKTVLEKGMKRSENARS